MSDPRSLLERESRRFVQQDGAWDRLIRRRDRKRRNQRITAGVVGIAVFVAAIWIVTSGQAFDQSTPAVPGSKTGPVQTGPPAAGAFAAPDVVHPLVCSNGARSRLELTDVGDWIKIRVEVYRSLAGHSWRIVLRHGRFPVDGNAHGDGQVKFEGTRVASENGDLAVQLVVRDQLDDWFWAKAVDKQTGQFCHVHGGI